MGSGAACRLQTWRDKAGGEKSWFIQNADTPGGRRTPVPRPCPPVPAWPEVLSPCEKRQSKGKGELGQQFLGELTKKTRCFPLFSGIRVEPRVGVEKTSLKST